MDFKDPVINGYQNQVTISPNNFHEQCISLHPQQGVIYSFEASKSVSFDIHYHKGQKEFYPVQESKITTKKGEFYPKTLQSYCWMWQHSHTNSVQLIYSLTPAKTRINKKEEY